MNLIHSHTTELQLTEFRSAAHCLQGRPARLHLLYGRSGVFTLSLAIGSAAQQPLAVIDSATRFNSYTLSKIAESLGIPPKLLLQRTYVTRSFTAFQTEAAITTKLPRFISTHPCKIVTILGLLDTYYDEQVKPHECQQSLRRIMQTLRGLVKKNINVIIADVEVSNPPRGKEKLFQLLKSTVDTVTVFEHHKNEFNLNEERRTKLWDETTIPSRLSSTGKEKHGVSFAER